MEWHDGVIHFSAIFDDKRTSYCNITVHTYIHIYVMYCIGCDLYTSKHYVPSKVVPEVAVPLSASTECTVFQIFLKMSDHPWKETSSVRASLRCV